MALGIELYLSGKTSEAIDCFEAGFECGPESRSFFHSWLGKMQLLQGRFSEAKQHFRSLIDQAPREPYHYYFYGIACLGLNELDRGGDSFERALELSPEMGNTAFLLSETRMLQGNSKLAQQYLSRAMMSRAIDLSFSRINDSHLRTLSEFPQLSHLILESTSISDAGLKSLQKLKGLNRLWIPGTGISDRGLSSLRDLPDLNSLVLTNTGITDEGVPHLLSMRNLKHLDLRHTQITPTGLRKLKDGLTDCLILN